MSPGCGEETWGNQVVGGKMGMRSGAVFHVSSISFTVWP
jgi:hypothetical protein